MCEECHETQLIPFRRNRERNPFPASPVTLLFDTSASTLGETREEMDNGLHSFQRFVNHDPLVRDAVEIGIFTFGCSELTHKATDFVSGRDFRVPRLPPPQGLTHMNHLWIRGIIETANRTQQLRSRDREVLKPMVVGITDGGATDPEAESKAIEASGYAARMRIETFLIGCGPYADMSYLRRLNPTREPSRMTSLTGWDEFFNWLRRSVQIISRPDNSLVLESPRFS